MVGPYFYNCGSANNYRVSGIINSTFRKVIIPIKTLEVIEKFEGIYSGGPSLWLERPHSLFRPHSC